MLGVPRSAQTSLAYASTHTLLISLLVYCVTRCTIVQATELVQKASFLKESH